MQLTLGRGIVRWVSISTLLGVATLGTSGAGPATDWQSRVSSALLKIYQADRTKPATGPPGPHQQPPHSLARFDSSGRVEIDVHFDCTGNEPTQALSAAGLAVSTSVHVAPFCVVEGWAAPATLPNIASIGGVTRVALPVYAHHGAPSRRPATKVPAAPRAAPKQSVPLSVPQSSIDGAGVNIMRSDVYAQQTGTNGSGVTVAVMSDDVTSLATIQGRGELPASITVYPSGGATPTPTDEGTMMLEEVHAVAPGATLAFCGPGTTVQYLTCLQAITGASVDIAVDDIGYFPLDLMSASSTFAQAVQNVLSAHPSLTLFSSAGNDNEAYWQGTYNPSTFTLNGSTTLTCNGQVDSYLENFGSRLNNVLTLKATQAAPVFLEWADPVGHNASNFDLYILDGSGNVLSCVAGARSADPFNLFAPNTPLSAGTYDLLIGTPDQSFAGKFLKLDTYGNGAATLGTTSTGSVDSPQRFLAAVQTVGAVDGGDNVGNNIEPFSATGPTQLEFPAPASLQAPVVAAPDDVAVDNVGTKFPSNPFFGTSAAAPNAAAVLALLQSSFQGVSASVLLAGMRAGAVPLGNGAPNGVYGYGRVDAVGALNAIALPTITAIGAVSIVGGQSSSQLPFTLTSVGNLSLAGSSDNTALVAFGASGNVTVTTGCGTTTDSCNLVIIPTLGQSGVVNLTISATDGGKRAASTMFAVTVTKPAAPGATVTANAAQSITVGGPTSAITLVLSGTGPFTATAASNNAALLPSSSITLTSGCGTSTSLDTCTATLAPVSGQTGTATITFSAVDPYAQTGTGTATLQVNAPPSHGGGALDLWALMTLGGLLARRTRRLN